ncbi:MAG: ACT domain-containing protein [Terrimesophilobacter sp.]
MPGLTDLQEMLKTLEPNQRAGEFVFVAVDAIVARGLPAEAMIIEEEAVTVVLRRSDADAAGLRYEYVAAWITLGVKSALESVGLTAAVSAALAEAGISCNMLAGYSHDHILVPIEQAERAIAALRALSRR